ncbi:MAG: tRNA (adenosine(37)-N6)-dimethylallyltransferase MiaA [Acidimicrobiales bacterium]
MRPEQPPPRHFALVGPTASGKSALALDLARRSGGIELVSVDSMQVYRGMDVGTAKPTPAEQREVPHHLLDLAEPHEEFTVARFQAAFREALDGIEARGHRALLVGGTGLYLRAVVDGFTIPGRWPEVVTELEEEPATEALHRRLVDLDPQAARRMEPTNRRRVVRALEVTLGSGRPFSSFGPGLDTYPPTPFELLGIWLPRTVVAERIERRYGAQMEAGFLEEVRRLRAGQGGLSRTAAQALGYRELSSHLNGGLSLAEALDLAVRRTRTFARRQRVWFGRDPRITWVGAGPDPQATLDALLGHVSSPSETGGDARRWLRHWSDMGPHLRLTKHHGLGNDFLVLLDQPGDAALARRVCDRRRGLGADGLVIATTGGPDGADLTMVVYNADGSRAEMSGNGIRCLAQAEATRATAHR